MRLILGIVLLLEIASAPVIAQPPDVRANSTNTEMTAIFNADQAERKVPKIDWALLNEADRSRRVRTQAMLDAGQLSSADDFYHAAYVFQHGDLPEDFLKAHALAIVAAARGKSEATWIAAATLDRYLQHIGQPQIYGTQYLRHDDGEWTQEPYRRDLLSDPLREATGVPPIAKQQDQLGAMAGKVRKDR